VFGLAEALAELRRRMDALEGEWLALVAEFDRSGEWEAAGYLSAASALRQVCRMDTGRAANEVALARKAAELPEAHAALTAGEISRSHVQAIADAFTPERAETLAPLESEFVDAARTCTPRELRSVLRYATDAIDGDGGAASDEAKHARRRWHMSRTFDGPLKIDAQFSGLDAEYWETAITAEMERERVAADPRTPAQWRADAATAIVRRSLDQGTLGTSREVRPHVTVVVDLEELPGSTPELIDVLRRERRYRGLLSRATLDRMMCDCDITRVVIAGRSEVLDVGRAKRTVTRAQWAALVVRDGGCTAPGCDAPPERCEAHHRRRWGEGGTTDLDNLELLCWRHHRQRHGDRERRPINATDRAA
jgi:5-methylcytosine-specific restriction protein A